MDPHQFSLSLDLDEARNEERVHLAVSVPQLGVVLVDSRVACALEVVEERPHELFVEQ